MPTSLVIRLTAMRLRLSSQAPQLHTLLHKTTWTNTVCVAAQPTAHSTHTTTAITASMPIFFTTAARSATILWTWLRQMARRVSILRFTVHLHLLLSAAQDTIWVSSLTPHKPLTITIPTRANRITSSGVWPKLTSIMPKCASA